MLQLADFDKLLMPMQMIYEKFSEEVILDIVRRLMKMGKLTKTAAWQVQRLVESGKQYNYVIDKISKLTSMSTKELNRTLMEAGVKSLKYDNMIITSAGFVPVNLNLSPAMAKVLVTNINKTDGLLKNLARSIAEASQTAFLNSVDVAYMEVVHGTMSYGQAIKQATKNLLQEGVTTVKYPSGHKDKVDVAVRRAVLTGVAQTANEISWKNILDMDVDLIETSAHIGARNKGDLPENHEMWQGKVFSRKNNPNFPDFLKSTGYGTVEGLAGINYRHTFYPYFESMPRNYTDEKLQEYAAKTVTYNNKEYDFYKATQMQRKMERDIRAAKLEAKAAQVLGEDAYEEKAKIKFCQARIRDFCRQTGLERQYAREGGK